MIDAAAEEGIVTVVAAGNDSDDACNYNPAGVPSAVTVGASDSKDMIAGYMVPIPMHTTCSPVCLLLFYSLKSRTQTQLQLRNCSVIRFETGRD